MDAKELLYQKIEERDRLEFSFGDTTDVKASIVLMLITFLAGLAASLLAEKDLNPLVRSGQGLVIMFLAGSTFFAVLCLRPRDYSMEKPPQNYADWLSQLSTYYAGQSDAEVKVFNEFRSGGAAKALERVQQNYSTNRAKLSQLYVAFWLLVAGLASELIMLLIATRLPS
jgi:hypothetical protein